MSHPKHLHLRGVNWHFPAKPSQSAKDRLGVSKRSLSQKWFPKNKPDARKNFEKENAVQLNSQTTVTENKLPAKSNVRMILRPTYFLNSEK
jgi:hypothetical protein